MKKMMKNYSLVAFLFAALSISFAFKGDNKVETKTANTEIAAAKCANINSDIVIYLETYGYSDVVVLSGYPWGGCDKECDTMYSYNTRVFVSGATITGHEDLPQ